jgi:hypothetical protein
MNLLILIPLTFAAILLAFLSYTLLILGRKIAETPDKGELMYHKHRDATKWHSPQRASRGFVLAFGMLFVIGALLALSANRILIVVGFVAVVSSVIMLGTLVFVSLKAYGLMRSNESKWRVGVAI